MQLLSVKVRVRPLIAATVAVLATAFALVACGGGGGGGATPPPSSTLTTATITGTVAKGMVLANATIIIKCANNSIYSSVSSSTGRWSVVVPSTAVPCLIQATSSSDATVWRSVALGEGNVNITPLTEMIVAQLLKALPGDAFAVYPTPIVVGLLTLANLATAQSDVRTALNGFSDLSVIPDFIATPFTAATATAAGDAIDKALDALTAALQAKGSSTQAVASAFAQGKSVSSTFGTNPRPILAAQVPTTGYTSAEGLLTPGVKQIGDVWAVPGTVVVDGGGDLAVSENNGITWSNMPQVVYNGRTAIGPGVILSGGGSGTLARHVRTQAGVWTTEALSGLKVEDPKSGAGYFMQIMSMAYIGDSYYGLMGDYDTSNEGAVYKSGDGVTWTKQNYRFDIWCELRNVVKTSDGAMRLCGNVSRDNGTTWTKQNSPYLGPSFFIGGTNIYIARSGEVWQSMDGDINSKLVQSNLTSFGGTYFPVATVVGEEIVAVSISGDSSHTSTHIVRSSDKGVTWTASEAGFSGVGLRNVYRTSMVAVGNEVFLTLGGDNSRNDSFLYQSHDGGKSWFVALKAETWGTMDLWSQDGQCYRQDYWWNLAYHWRTESSSDGLNWTQIATDQLPRALDDKGTRLRQVVTSVPPPSGSGSWILDQTTVEKYDQNTGNWRTVLRASTATLATNPSAADGALYVGFSSLGQLLKSTDQGETWQQVTGSTVPPYTENIQALGNRTLMAVNMPKPCVGACSAYTGFSEGVFISPDEGATWRRIPEFGVPRSVAVGNGVVIGSMANGAPGLVKMSPPYISATVMEPSFGATSDFSYKTVLFEENTFWFSDAGGKLRMSSDGANTWQTVQLDVTDAISRVAVCGHRLVFYSGQGLVASPATLP